MSNETQTSTTGNTVEIENLRAAIRRAVQALSENPSPKEQDTLLDLCQSKNRRLLELGEEREPLVARKLTGV